MLRAYKILVLLIRWLSGKGLSNAENEAYDFLEQFQKKGIKVAVGAESEAVIAAALIQAGYTVLTPNGYMHRYDLVIEDAEGKFWKIQCKTAWLSQEEEFAYAAENQYIPDGVDIYDDPDIRP